MLLMLSQSLNDDDPEFRLCFCLFFELNSTGFSFILTQQLDFVNLSRRLPTFDSRSPSDASNKRNLIFGGPNWIIESQKKIAAAARQSTFVWCAAAVVWWVRAKQQRVLIFFMYVGWKKKQETPNSFQWTSYWRSFIICFGYFSLFPRRSRRGLTQFSFFFTIYFLLFFTSPKKQQPTTRMLKSRAMYAE